VRGLLLGTGIDTNAWLVAAWCVAITVVGYVWAKKLYNRDPSRWIARSSSAAPPDASRGLAVIRQSPRRV
jgi:hypothetical protein